MCILQKDERHGACVISKPNRIPLSVNEISHNFFPMHAVLLKAVQNNANNFIPHIPSPIPYYQLVPRVGVEPTLP